MAARAFHFAALVFLSACGGREIGGGAAPDSSALEGGDATATGDAVAEAATPEGAATESGAAVDGGMGSEGADGGNPSGPPPSCAPGGPGMTDCGEAHESCCTSLPVVGGTFYRTYHQSDGGATTGEADPATVSSFRLDKYDVTVGRFRQFVGAWAAGWLPPEGSGKHTHLNDGEGLLDVSPPLPGGVNQPWGAPGTSAPPHDAGPAYEHGWGASVGNPILKEISAITGQCDGLGVDGGAVGTWTPSVGDQERLPINCITWYEAYAFCTWDGGFLPSLAELEYASAGGSEQREYPWGAAQPGTDNRYAISDCNYPTPTRCAPDNPPPSEETVANIAPVGTASSGAGRWGQLDLLGELRPWVIDVLVGLPWYINPCIDCATVTGDGDALFWGSDFASPVPTPAWPPGNFVATGGDERIGVRCARRP